MGFGEIFVSIVMAMSIPSLVCSFVVKRLEKKLDKEAKEKEEKEEVREKNTLLLIKAVGASLALGEATAHAIKDGKCNGEMSAALEYSKQIKHEQEDFLYEQSVKNVI